MQKLISGELEGETYSNGFIIKKAQDDSQGKLLEI